MRTARGRHAHRVGVQRGARHQRHALLDDSYHLGQTIVNDYGSVPMRTVSTITPASAATRPPDVHALCARGVSGCAVRRGILGSVGADAVEHRAIPDHFVPSNTTPPYYARPRLYSTKPPFRKDPSPPRPRDGFSRQISPISILNHVISFGKQDQWLGPAEGASMAFSNNAQTSTRSRSTASSR